MPNVSSAQPAGQLDFHTVRIGPDLPGAYRDCQTACQIGFASPVRSSSTGSRFTGSPDAQPAWALSVGRVRHGRHPGFARTDVPLYSPGAQAETPSRRYCVGEPTTMKLGIAVLGATGYIGTPYRDEIRESGPDARIVTLCARRRDRLEAAGRQDRAALITEDWRAAIEHPDVNCVVVATPDALHFESVMACAALKKHVFCEKPVALNTRQAHEIWSAFQTSSLGHFVPFWTRYVPVFAKAREVVQSGVLGEIQTVVYRWHNPRPAAIPFTWRDDASLSAAGSIADVGLACLRHRSLDDRPRGSPRVGSCGSPRTCQARRGAYRSQRSDRMGPTPIRRQSASLTQGNGL